MRINEAFTDPICEVQWLDARDLNANDYNPNVVLTPELNLLERSIMLLGWVQPIIVAKDLTIIDGFHRATLGYKSASIREKYNFRVPCVVLPMSRPEAMITTIRMNRAKGTHVALRMHSIVTELIETHGWDAGRVAREIGADKSEIELLQQDGVFKALKLDGYKYSEAWKAGEDGKTWSDKQREKLQENSK